MSLSRTQLDHLEGRLIEERRRIERELDKSADERAGEDSQERAGDLTKIPTHAADLGTDTIDEELAASNETRMSRELDDIDAALTRLRETPDRFGKCEDSGKDIPLARLEVIPWARTCGDKNG